MTKWSWTNEVYNVWSGKLYGDMDELERVSRTLGPRDVIEIGTRSGRVSRQYITDIFYPIPYGKSGKGYIIAFVRGFPCQSETKAGKPCSNIEKDNTGFCKVHVKKAIASTKEWPCNGCGGIHRLTEQCEVGSREELPHIAANQTYKVSHAYAGM